MSSGAAAGNGRRQKFELKAEEELRIEVGEGNQVVLSLQSGDAEIYGAELARNKNYNLTNVKLPIFSWHGCTVTVTGPTEIAYTASETPMPIYANTYAVLQQRRRAAAAAPAPSPSATEGAVKDRPIGPRVLILGPPDSGKTALASLMLNYAVKASSKALFVDLDITKCSMSIPGCIGASTVSHVEIEDGPLFEAPLAFYYGHLDPNNNPKELERLIGQLGDALETRLRKSEDDNLRGCGYIATTGGWVEECGREFIGGVIKAMRADHVFVIGAERMYADVSQVVAGTKNNVEVVHLPRSGGVVRRDATTRRRDIARGFRSYFYGMKADLNPFTVVLDFEDVTILRVGGGPAVPLSALPIGAEPTLNPLRIAAVTIGNDLMHSVLGVCQAKEEAEVPNSPVSGFVHITKVDMEKKKLSVLAPSPGRLPSRYLLVGSLKWLE